MDVRRFLFQSNHIAKKEGSKIIRKKHGKNIDSLVDTTASCPTLCLLTLSINWVTR